jgi:coenzyme Q-binding protein COQ10
MAGASRSIVIDAPMEKVFQIITDYEKYAEFLPEARETKVLSRSGNAAKVQYTVEVMKKIKYTLEMRESPPDRVEWSFVEGEFMKDNQGHWKLEPAGEGKTKATYNIEMRLGALVPKAIVNTLVDKGLPGMLEAFKRRAEGR